MAEFWSEWLAGGFLNRAVAAVLLASVACAVVGPYVVARRVGHLAGGIAHIALGGIGVAMAIGAPPLLGAGIASIAGALVIALLTLRGLQGEDTVVNALWATSMAGGILLISMTPGYNVDLLSYLFGKVLLVTPRDLIILLALDVLLVGLVLSGGRLLTAVCFDEEFARTRGLPTGALYLALLVIVALTVVALVRVAGLVLVIALLTLPAATAALFSRSLTTTMLLSAGLGMAASLGGLAVSFAADVPSGVTIVLLAGLMYGAGLGLHRIQTWRGARRSRTDRAGRAR